jgi:hypothetical protein
VIVVWRRGDHGPLSHSGERINVGVDGSIVFIAKGI